MKLVIVDIVSKRLNVMKWLNKVSSFCVWGKRTVLWLHWAFFQSSGELCICISSNWRTLDSMRLDLSRWFYLNIVILTTVAADHSVNVRSRSSTSSGSTTEPSVVRERSSKSANSPSEPEEQLMALMVDWVMNVMARKRYKISWRTQFPVPELRINWEFPVSELESKS